MKKTPVLCWDFLTVTIARASPLRAHRFVMHVLQTKRCPSYGGTSPRAWAYSGLGDAMVRSVSMGTRQTRKERRARRRRAELRKSASATLIESARTGRNILRESVSTVLRALITAAHTLARGVGKPAGIVLRGSSHAGRNVLRGTSRAGRNLLIAVAHVSTRDAVRDLLLFVALLSSSAAVVASVLADKIELAILFCLLTLILCAALWVRGLVSRRRSSVD